MIVDKNIKIDNIKTSTFLKRLIKEAEDIYSIEGDSTNFIEKIEEVESQAKSENLSGFITTDDTYKILEHFGIYYR